MVGDLQAFAGERQFAAGAEFAGRRRRSRATSMRCSVFGAGNQGRRASLQDRGPQNSLFAREMLGRFAVRTTGD